MAVEQHQQNEPGEGGGGRGRGRGDNSTIELLPLGVAGRVVNKAHKKVVKVVTVL